MALRVDGQDDAWGESVAGKRPPPELRPVDVPPADEPHDTRPAATPPANADRHRSALVDWTRFWATDRLEEDWLVEPILPRGRAIATYSPAKQGKSLLSLDVAVRASLGRRLVDQPPGRRIRVVYLDLEMTEGDLYERLDDMGHGPHTDLSHLAYYLLPSLPPLDTAAGGAEVRTIAANHDADLVIIDTTSRVLAGPENDSDTLRAFHRHTGGPLKTDGRTVWRLDHAGKDLDRGQRGSSAKNDDVDIVWQLLARDGGNVRLRATHRRLSWVPELVDLVRLDDPLRHERTTATWPPGTVELAAVLETLDVPLEHGGKRVRRALRDAGHQARNDTIAAAVRYRREVGDTLGDTLGAQSRDTLPGHLVETAQQSLGTPSGTPGDTLPQSNGPQGCPPMGTPSAPTSDQR